MEGLLIGVLATGVFLGSVPLARAADAPGAAARIARWKDDKKAAFTLAFDDSTPSQVKNAVPELKKRGLVGTFYINAGAGHYNKEAWEKEIPLTGMEYGNHTFTHVGARDVAHLEEELAKANEAIARCFPDRKTPRLISFGRPGVKPGAWAVTDEQLKPLLAKYNLVERPPFNGAAIHLKTAEDMTRLVDTALAKGTLEHIDFHGVGGDWLSAPLPDFITLLDKLVSVRDRLWITDPISVHKYETERDGAELKVLESGPKQVRLSLACKANPALYDLPLTLVVPVPAAWQPCTVAQGAQMTTATAAGGAVTCSALPGTDEIVIRPATK
ncbi:MAG: polysaccharide deacetylase family protein [Planctomycetes bacterium]|nr:polysaccharide deacetylase family protein [Planctomycetota bacterium]